MSGLSKATALVNGKEKKMRMSFSDSLQERIFYVVIWAMIAGASVSMISLVVDCRSNDQRAFANCIAAGGDKYKCCSTSINIDCLEYKED
ncbi:MAG: hypothetical protein L3J47_00645 [Sulfurovum sp.]|nr:hypothetical protein [Sulfurovum sp.]